MARRPLRDFTLNADGAGANDLSGTSPVDSGAGLKADTWTLSESVVAGYTKSDWDCVGGGTYNKTAGGVETIQVGLNGEATCTITNDDIAPKLHLRKIVTNDNGGTKTVADFTLNADGAGANDLSGTSPVDSGASLKADTWTLSESVVAGYTKSDWDCVGGGTYNKTAGGVETIQVGLNGEATCTITNDDIAPKLHLRKIVTNDNGGTKTVADFTLNADGTGANDLSGTSPVDSGASLKADTWTLSESVVAGYTKTDWDCVGGGTYNKTAGGVETIQVGLNGEATCTITNDDIAPKLHLRKIVTNDNGGTKTVADFTLNADGTGANDLSGTSPVDSGASLKADTWTLSESVVAGYTKTDWDCVGGGTYNKTAGGVETIQVGLNGEATCTITNDDQPGTIVIIKNAKPASGVFTYPTTGSTSGPGTSWPASFTLNGDPTGGGNTKTFKVDVGTYKVTEQTQLGWILTGIGGSTDANTPYNCVVTGSGGSTGVGDLNTQAVTIAIKNGDTVTCTFENTGQGVTRTQGFWATHSPLANIAWFGGDAFGHSFPGVANTPGLMNKTLDPCGKNIDTLGKLMGGFWSDIAKKSTGVKRIGARPGEDAAPAAVARGRAERLGLRQRAGRRLRKVRRVGGRVLRHEPDGDPERHAGGCLLQQLGRQRHLHAWHVGRQQERQSDREQGVLEQPARNETTAVDSRLEGGPGDAGPSFSSHHHVARMSVGGRSTRAGEVRRAWWAD